MHARPTAIRTTRLCSIIEAVPVEPERHPAGAPEVEEVEEGILVLTAAHLPAHSPHCALGRPNCAANRLAAETSASDSLRAAAWSEVPRHTSCSLRDRRAQYGEWRLPPPDVHGRSALAIPPATVP